MRTCFLRNHEGKAPHGGEGVNATLKNVAETIQRC